MDVYVNYGITYIAFVLYVPSMSPSLPLSNKINQSINQSFLVMHETEWRESNECVSVMMYVCMRASQA